jgi:hypothetical protein
MVKKEKSIEEHQASFAEISAGIRKAITDCWKSVVAAVNAKPNKPSYRNVLPRNKQRW